MTDGVQSTNTRTETRHLVDANVLVALSLEAHAHHTAAHVWLGTLGTADVLLNCPTTDAAFIRLLMNPAVVGPATYSAASAVGQLEALKDWGGPRWRTIADDATLAAPTIDRETLLTSLVGHKQVTDFHLLNLAAKHDARLATFDHRIARALPPSLVGYVEELSVLADSMKRAQADGTADITAEQAVEAIDAIRHQR
jgi:toxin-antitoxin system PIN domain toxin